MDGVDVCTVDVVVVAGYFVFSEKIKKYLETHSTRKKIEYIATYKYIIILK